LPNAEALSVPVASNAPPAFNVVFGSCCHVEPATDPVRLPTTVMPPEPVFWFVMVIAPLIARIPENVIGLEPPIDWLFVLKVYVPVPDVNVVPLCINPPWNVTASLAEFVHTPPELIVTEPINVFVPVVLVMLIVPETLVVPVTLVVKAPKTSSPEVTVRLLFTVVFPPMVTVPPLLMTRLSYVYAPPAV
jgi:hypothetical protein